MKTKGKDFINLLDDLCNVYKDYTKNNDGSWLEVIIQNNTIKMYLYDDKYNDVLVDEFGFSFDKNEIDKYYYVSMVLMKLLFANDIIYNKDNVFYEKMDASLFKIVVNDNELFNKMINAISIYRDFDFYDKIDNSRRVRNKVNRDSVIMSLDERVNISKKLLRTRR